MTRKNPLITLGYNLQRIEEGVMEHGDLLSFLDSERKELTDLIKSDRFPGSNRQERKYNQAFSTIENAETGKLNEWLVDAARPKISKLKYAAIAAIAAVAGAIAGAVYSCATLPEPEKLPAPVPVEVPKPVPEPEVVDDNFLSWPVDQFSGQWNNIMGVYGKRMKRDGKMGKHKAIDIGLDIGTPIMAAADGVVNFRCNSAKHSCNGFGTSLAIDHGNLSTLYLHLIRFEKGIEKGVEVKKGDVIGYSGNTGIVRGPHLHFAVLDWDSRQAYNPFCFFPDSLLRDMQLGRHGKKIYGDTPLNSKHPTLVEQCANTPKYDLK